MKTILFSLAFTILIYACKTKQEVSQTFNESPEIIKEPVQNQVEEVPLIIKEENIIAVNESEPILPNEHYFIIMGSFKILSNANKYQDQIHKEGFESQLLKNEQGLYRVSVSSFKEIIEAREKVYWIRKKYPQYYDVWLLRKI